MKYPLTMYDFPAFPSEEYMKVYLCVDRVKQPFILHSRHAFDELSMSYCFNSLFNKVRGKEETCYWNVFGRFKFFADIDMYKAPAHTTSIDDVLSLISELCDEFLVCETSVKNGRASYSVHTDRVVNFQEALRIERELLEKLSFGQPGETQRFRRFYRDDVRSVPMCVVDPMFHFMEPFGYRRAPFSLHGHSKENQAVPRLDLSNVSSGMSDLDLFKFSYPNMIGDNTWT